MPEAERARLLQQRQQRRLRRRHRDRRQIAHHLVDVDHRAQRGRAALHAHPRDDFVEQQRDEEHPFAIVEVGDRQDRDARLAGVGVEQRIDVERIALEPHREVGRGEQPVEIGGELEPIGGGEEAVELEDADALKRRRLHLRDERGEVERLLLLPGLAQERRHEDVLAARSGSASMPASVSTLVAAAEARSASSSGSPVIAAAGA